MKRSITYQAAKSVSQPIHEHFSKNIVAAREQGAGDIAPIPETSVIEAMVDTIFWASMRREEGHSPKISVAYLPPELAGEPLLFAQRIPFYSYSLTKLAPGAERPGIHLGIWHDEDELYIWGSTLTLPDFCMVIEVSEPGLMVVKYRRTDGHGKFANLAVLVGDQIKLVAENSIEDNNSPDILSAILGTATPGYWNRSVNVLVQLALSMRAHERGGALLIVPSDNREWRDSTIKPLNYDLFPPYPGLHNVLKQQHEQKKSQSWQTAMKREVAKIAGFTAIDGATIMNDQYKLLAFGVKLGRVDGKKIVDKIFIKEPVVGGKAITEHPSKAGGTRHLSAAQFVFDQRDCLALVASQDGRFTVFSWCSREQIVQAYRIDTLLL